MTFREYIIQEKSLNFYERSLEHLNMFNVTIEEYFPSLFIDYKILEDYKTFKINEMINKKVVITDVVGGLNKIMSTPKIKNIEKSNILLDDGTTLTLDNNNFKAFLNGQATWLHPNEVLICIKS